MMGHAKTALICWMFLCCFSLCAGKVHAQSLYEADIVIPSIIENSLQKNRVLDGEHGEVVQSILDYHKGGLTHRVMAPSHAFQAFYDGKFACVTPDTRLYYEEGSPYIDSEALSSTKWVIVQRQGDNPILVKSDLTGKLVGTFYPADEIASIVPQEGVRYDVYADIKTNLIKVAMKRIDLAILPHRGIAEMISAHEELSGLSIDTSPPMATVHEGIMCHNDETGQKIIQKVNEALQKQK